jgi:YVTN family beta-propeller protein
MATPLFFVANKGSNDISIINAVSLDVITSINVGLKPTGIAYGDNSIVVTSGILNSTSLIYNNTGVQVPYGIIYGSAGFAIVDNTKNSIMIGETIVSIGINPKYVTFGNRYYAVTNGDGTISIISATSLTVVTVLEKINHIDIITGICYDVLNNHFIVVGYPSSYPLFVYINIIDVATLSYIHSIKIKTYIYNTTMGIAWGNGLFAVALDNKIMIYDASTYTQIGSSIYRSGILSLAYVNGYFAVADAAATANCVYIVNPSSQMIIKTISVGKTPSGITASP